MLLLDEPTNYLDLPALRWLEEFVGFSRKAMIIVSHDRAFMDATVTSMLVLDEKAHSLRVFAGGYSEYLRQRTKERAEQEARYRDQQAEIKRVQQEIRSLKGSARSIERETTHFHYRKIAKGVARRAKVQERRLERSLESDDAIERPAYDQRLYLGSIEESGIRDRRLILAAGGMTAGAGERMLWSDVDVMVRGGDRVAVLGPNGAGKSVLLRSLLGEWPVEGTVRWGDGVRPGFLRQEQARADFAPGVTVLQALREVATGEESSMRALFDQFLFTGRMVEREVRSLSYGERVRLELARLVGAQAGVLLLDEPTSHLDLPAIEELQSALARYRGSMIVVSHDRAFLRTIGIGHVWLIADGTIHVDADAGALERALTLAVA
jgi:ATP-binding cassette subfamily F protein 3